tara:strand:- start:813 stop:2522 length:1710 start_codon:yes stop_codon:yes gene_type:complete
MIKEPISMNYPLFSIYYENDGFNIKGDKLMGRQAAGWSFLKSIISSKRYKRLGIYIRDASQQELLRSDIKSLLKNKNNTIEIESIPYDKPFLSENYGGIQLPGPALKEYSKHRSFFGHHKYSLVGLTHTTASHSVMSAFSSICTEAIMPWDSIICTSESVLNTLNKIVDDRNEFLSFTYKKKINFKPKFPVIPLGINYEEFNYDDKFKKVSRDKLNISEEDIVIVFVGRLSFHAKAHNLPMYIALENCAKKLKKNQKIHLIQTGWFANSFIEKTFKSEAKNVCPSVNCIFLDGRIQENKNVTLASGDIFMSLSDNIQETFGLTPLEGMASGLPVIVSDWNGYRSTVRNNLDGFTVKSLSLPGGYGEGLAFDYMMHNITYDKYIGSTVQKTALDVKDCINKLDILLFDNVKRLKMGENAKKRARDVFSWDKILLQYEDLYKELNEIRLTEYLNYKQFCLPRLPSDKLDPFYIFDDYPTEIISNKISFRLSSDIHDLSIQEIIDFESVNYSKDILPSIEMFDLILSSFSQNKFYNINDLMKVTKLREYDIYLVIVFLIKYGFITTVGNKYE